MLIDRYFEILRDYFGKDYETAKKDNFSDEAIYRIRKKYADRVIAQSIIQTLLTELKDLDWKVQEISIRKKGGIKAHYVGSESGFLEPSAWNISNFLRKTALYADTIVLEEQVLNQLISSIYMNNRLTMDFVIDYAIEFLSLEENHIFASNSDYPICELAPALVWSLNENNIRETAWNLICKSTTDYASQLYNKSFNNVEELRSYLSQIDDTQFLNVHNNQRLITPNNIEINSQWLKRQRSLLHSSDTTSFYEAVLRILTPLRIYDLMYSGLLGTIPITDSKNAWDAINWLIKNDNEHIFAKAQKKAFSKDALIMNGLSKLQHEDYRWLGNVPIDKLSLLRERGELVDIRRILGEGIDNIQEASDDDFFDTAKQVYDNIDIALRKHKADLAGVKDKYQNISGIDTLLTVSGSISFVSALYQSYASSAGILASFPSIASGITSVALIGRDYINRRNELKALRKKPIAILFETKEDQKTK